MASSQGSDIGIVACTAAGVFDGALHVPQGSSVLEHLNRAPEHLRLAGARFDGDTEVVPFLAVRRDAVLCVMAHRADDVERLAPRAGDGRVVAVAGILPGYRFQGSLVLSAGQRVTDFLGTAPAFVAVRDCNLLRAQPGRADVSFEPGVALVRANAIVAFSDTLS